MILVAHLRMLKPLIEVKCLTSLTGNAQGSRVSTAESVNCVYPRLGRVSVLCCKAFMLALFPIG